MARLRSMLVRLVALGMVGVLAAYAAAPARAQQLAGVVVDADGVLHKRLYDDASGDLMRARIAAARATLGGGLQENSPLRKISLNRLEAALAKRLAQGLPPTPEMQYLAGLTRIEYVFLYPDSGDLVLAGPAEGWVEDLSGRVRGLSSGRPVLELEDLAVALRIYPPGGQQKSVVGCSIDPTSDGLARMQQFLRQVQSIGDLSNTDAIVEGLRTSLGLQTVSIMGVPASTHFAQVMVEADYRMKLIGIGLERPPIKLASYVDRAGHGSAQAMARWFFVPDYECVAVSDDHLAMHIIGQGVQLVAEEEVVNAEGQRASSAVRDRASEAFVTGFTKKYPELAAKSPVFAQLRNLIDMLVATAFLQKYDWYAQASFSGEFLRDESRFPVETHAVPQQVETAARALWKGNRLMMPVGGGVQIRAELALAPERVTVDSEGAIAAERERVAPDLAAGQWWWD